MSQIGALAKYATRQLIPRNRRAPCLSHHVRAAIAACAGPGRCGASPASRHSSRCGRAKGTASICTAPTWRPRTGGRGFPATAPAALWPASRRGCSRTSVATCDCRPSWRSTWCRSCDRPSGKPANMCPQRRGKDYCLRPRALHVPHRTRRDGGCRRVFSRDLTMGPTLYPRAFSGCPRAQHDRTRSN